MITSLSDAFFNKLKTYINQEIHLKLEGDEQAVPYTLKEVERDFLVVDYGESQRIISINKIIFLQIGSYPYPLSKLG